MAEKVCSLPSRIDASVYQCTPDDCRNCDRMRKPAYRSPVPEENSAASTVRSASAQVQCDRLTNVVRQWQLCPASTLAPDGNPALVPIDVFQVQRNDLTGSQTQSGEQQQNGIVPLPNRSVPFTVIENSLNFASRQELRQCGKGP